MSFNGICSFCFSDVNNENADLITDTTKEILDVLLINLDLSDTSDRVICNVCSDSLFAAFKFKSTCKYTEATIIPYVDWDERTQLDLWEIYLRERDNKRTVTLSENEQVCRLCMELTGKMHVPLQNINKDVFQKFLPEINVNIIKNPVVCKTCFDTFPTHSNFLKKFKSCIDQKEAVKGSVGLRKMDRTDELPPIKMEEVGIKLEDKLSFDSCLQLEPIKMEVVLYNEDKDIKAELDADGTSVKSLVSKIHPVAMKSKGQTIQIETSGAEIKSRISCINDDMVQKPQHKDSSAVQMHKCDFCAYKTKFKRYLKRHQVIHNDPSEMQMYECDTCDYKTRRKRDLKRHQLTHKSILERHQLVQKDPSQVQMHKCDICTYQTMYKGKLKSHQLVHKDPSEVQMFSCDDCEYKSKFKSDLKRHQLTHKDPSQVQIYRCDFCDYETKCKQYLKAHQLKHKDLSEVQAYNCDICDYKTKVKRSLQMHSIVHRDPSKLKQFTCDLCDFRTYREGSLKQHQLVHKDPSQVQMYKCDICPYETKYKGILKSHQLVHKESSEVQMFNCDDCEYKSKFKGNLKQHRLTHKGPSQMQMHKCDILLMKLNPRNS